MTLRRVAATQIALPVEEYAVAGEAYNRKEVNGIGQESRGNGLTPPVLQSRMHIHLVGTSLVLTNQLLADAFMNSDNAHIHPIDLAGYNQARLTGRVTVVGAAAAKLQCRFRAGAFSTTVADYLIMGATSVEIGLAALGVIDSGWIDLVTAAKVDGIFMGVMSIGGDGALDPSVANVRIQFR